MKSQWIVRSIADTHNPNLILFFNGWGMDQRIVSHLRNEADSDVLMVYDYDDLTLSDTVIRDIRAYQRVDVLAWSMGVWAYTTVQAQLAARIRKAVALNGTPRPIDDVFGIPTAIYNTTVQQFSEASRQKFFQRMCGDADTLRWFAPRQPNRTLDEQREELIAIQRAVAWQCEPDPGPLSKKEGKTVGLSQEAPVSKLTPRPPLLQREGEKRRRCRPVFLPPLSSQERGPGGEFFLQSPALKGGGRKFPPLTFGKKTAGAVYAGPNGSIPFTCALISRRDKIMPTPNQLQYWQGTVDYTLIDAPHCAFRHWNSWKEIFNHVTID